MHLIFRSLTKTISATSVAAMIILLTACSPKVQHKIVTGEQMQAIMTEQFGEFEQKVLDKLDEYEYALHPFLQKNYVQMVRDNHQLYIFVNEHLIFHSHSNAEVIPLRDAVSEDSKFTPQQLEFIQASLVRMITLSEKLLLASEEHHKEIQEMETFRKKIRLRAQQSDTKTIQTVDAR